VNYLSRKSDYFSRIQSSCLKRSKNHQHFMDFKFNFGALLQDNYLLCGIALNQKDVKAAIAELPKHVFL